MQFTLCCLFHQENIKFKTYNKNTPIEKALDVCSFNISSLKRAFGFCESHGLAYRVSSDLFPHADSYGELLPYEKLPKSIINLSMHPGQHVNMGSPTDSVVENSISDINYHLKISKHIGCKETNIHIGGSYGNKKEAKKRFISNMKTFFANDLDKITIENDELNFHVLDVLEVCEALGTKPVFDIHHHRCHQLKEKLSISEEEIFYQYSKFWKNTTQRLHLSNPRNGYTTAAKSRPHSDLITDFPEWLRDKNIVLDIEAKHKEIAIFHLKNKLNLQKDTSKT